MTIDDALKEAANRGLLLNNLFQIADGSWQANFRIAVLPHDSYTDYGRGESAVESIQSAISQFEKKGRIPETPVVDSVFD